MTTTTTTIVSFSDETYIVGHLGNGWWIEGGWDGMVRTAKKVINKNCITPEARCTTDSCIFNRVRVIIIARCLPTEMSTSLYLHIISKSRI